MSFILLRCFDCFSKEEYELSPSALSTKYDEQVVVSKDKSELDGGLQIFRTERKTIRYNPY